MKHKEGGFFCKVWFSHIRKESYDRHYNQCKEFKARSSMKIPRDGKIFIFAIIHGIEKYYSSVIMI